MRMSPLMKRFMALLVITGSFLGLMVNAEPAHASCVWPIEEGNWTNDSVGTSYITRVNIEFVCPDSGPHADPSRPTYYINLFGNCIATDCDDWGEVVGYRDETGWIRTTIDHGFATSHVWVQGYYNFGDNRLLVYMWTDFHDGRRDHVLSELFQRS